MGSEIRLHRYKPGDKEIHALHFNQTNELVEALANIQVGSAVTLIRDDGAWYLDVDVPRMVLAMTPSGGIPAATLAGSYVTPGSATCQIYSATATGWQYASGSTGTIYNTQVGGSIPGSAIVSCQEIDGRLVVNPGSYASIAKAQTSSGGIAANGSAIVTLGTWGGSSYSSIGSTVTAWNPSATTAVGGSTWVTIAWASGRWEVILEPC
jgi:hypothetical protein